MCRPVLCDSLKIWCSDLFVFLMSIKSVQNKQQNALSMDFEVEDMIENMKTFLRRRAQHTPIDASRPRLYH